MNLTLIDKYEVNNEPFGSCYNVCVYKDENGNIIHKPEVDYSLPIVGTAFALFILLLFVI